METVRRGASESTVFGLKSTIKSTKVVKKRWCISSGTGGREFESRHFDQKKRTAPCEWFSFLSKRCYDSNLSCVARCEFAYHTRRSESLLSRRRGRIYSPLAKIPPHDSIAATSPTARKYSLLFGGAYAPNDAIYRKRYAFTTIIMPSNFFLLGRVPINSYQLFMPRLPAASTKKHRWPLRLSVFFV